MGIGIRVVVLSAFLNPILHVNDDPDVAGARGRGHVKTSGIASSLNVVIAANNADWARRDPACMYWLRFGYGMGGDLG
jgi:hypothetical protein